VVHVWKATTAQVRMQKQMSEGKTNMNSDLIVLECLEIRMTKAVQYMKSDGSASVYVSILPEGYSKR
jgi:hypothetical protein